MNSRFLTSVKRNIRRTPYQALAASGVMFLTFLTLLLFILMGLGTQKIIKTVENMPQVMAFFKDGTQPQDINAIASALNQTGKIASMHHTTHEEAFKIYKENNKDKPVLTDLVTASLLPESLDISTNNPNDLQIISDMLKREPVVSDVVFPKDVVDNIIQVSSIARFVGLTIVLFLIFFSILIILLIIGFKIRIKRTEIEIMKLLGASNWFIQVPFMLEGISYGVTGAFMAWIATYIILWYITPYVQGNIPTIKLLPLSPVIMLELLLVAICAAVLIGFIGSYSALRRYLKL